MARGKRHISLSPEHIQYRPVALRDLVRFASAVVILACVLNSCRGDEKNEAKRTPGHACDDIIFAARTGRFPHSIRGTWGVNLGFQIQLDAKGKAEFRNFQLDKQSGYLDGRIQQNGRSILVEGLYHEAGTVFQGAVHRIECTTEHPSKLQDFSNLNLILYADRQSLPYVMERQLSQIVPERCLRLETSSGIVHDCGTE